MPMDASKCQVTATFRLSTSDVTFQCEGQPQHKGHCHFQMPAKIHRPPSTCGRCDHTKEEKRFDQKVQVSFYAG
jgi:hypothetical protein